MDQDGTWEGVLGQGPVTGPRKRALGRGGVTLRFGGAGGDLPWSLGNDPGRGGGRAPGGCPGQGLGAALGRMASAGSVCQELLW